MSETEWEIRSRGDFIAGGALKYVLSPMPQRVDM